MDNSTDRRFLVTTADEASWSHGRAILFLGEWCRRFSRREIWSRLDAKLQPYHWDDRKKYYADYHYLEILYEKNLVALSKSLGFIHGVSQDVRYWRIIIGPWLRFFSDSIFDRFESIRSVVESDLAEDSRVLRYDLNDWVPSDFSQFYTQFIGDEWNHIVFAECMKNQNFPASACDISLSKDSIKPAIKVKYSFKKKLAENYSRIVPQAFNKVVMASAAISLVDLSKLQLAMGQLPWPVSPLVKVEGTEHNLQLRATIDTGLEGISTFESLLDTLIRKWIPRAYIENFQEFRESALKNFPSSPEVIYTANAYQADDGFKMWAAHHVIENGVPLAIGQHGGNMGIALFSQAEDHQKAIADKFFTWGWIGEGDDKVQSAPAMKLGKLKAKPDNRGDILITTASYPRYFYCHYSIPVAGQYLNYLQDQIDFIKCLDTNLCQFVRIRPDSDSFGWGVLDRLKDAGVGWAIDKGGMQSLGHRLDRCRLSVATTNSTVFLETLSENFPTLVFFDPERFEIRHEAVAAMNSLREVGILHDSPESAAQLINQIGDDIASWWAGESLQAARRHFCNQYARSSAGWIAQWKAVFSKLKGAN